MMIAFSYTLAIVALGTSFLGAGAGAVGVYVFLRKQALMADAISHATLPGIVLCFLLFHTENPLLLILGGMVTGMLGSLLVWYVHAHTRLSIDALLGVVLSVFFGCGLVLMTQLQKSACAKQALLNKFLFGNAALLLEQDLYFIVPAVVVVFALLYFYSYILQLSTFDSLYTQALGYNIRLIDLLLTFLLLLVVGIGLSTVGVILMSTMIVAPGVAARQWSSQCRKVVQLAALFGALSAVVGSCISTCALHVPTGPVITVIAIAWTCASLLIAPHRGIMWQGIR